ncbi:unnamed protein product [Lathyrus sativus]|nr:unnamed protein product [Lathyrus sativus]
MQRKALASAAAAAALEEANATECIIRNLRLEKLNWSAAEGKAKVIGTLIGTSGAVLLTFYKGAEINIGSSNINLLHAHHNQIGDAKPQHVDFSNKLLGVLCAIGSSCSFSLWFIIQAKMHKEYPSHHSSTALMSTMGAIQATVFALCVDRDWIQWKLGYNIRLLTAASSGIVTFGIATIVVAWCIKMRGPLFAAVFYPLQLIIVAVSAYLLLDEKLYLGSILGAVLIVCGLYVVLWSKNEEMKEKAQLMSRFTLLFQAPPTVVVHPRAPPSHPQTTTDHFSNSLLFYILLFH